MAYYYMDTDAGSDVSNGTTWALAKLTYEGLLAIMAAGDIGVIQGAATDTAAAARTFTSPGTLGNPIKIIGVKDGTTNTGTSIVASDLVVRGTDTLPKIEITGAGNDVTCTGSFSMYGIDWAIIDRTNLNTSNSVVTFNGCVLRGSRLRTLQAKINLTTIKCEHVCNIWAGAAPSKCEVLGGEYTGTVTYFLVTPAGTVHVKGLDLSGSSASSYMTFGEGITVFSNCKIPATMANATASITSSVGSFTSIGCNSATSKDNGTSYQDYSYEDMFGTIDDEATIVRTGGADDGASGLFSYAMTAKADKTTEGTADTLKSPWLSVWVGGGASKTFTVYICNDTASTDYNEDEVRCEFYTVDDADTAQHDQTFDPANAYLLESSTAVTDDTGSTWGTGGNNHQKFSATVTPGFEGLVYARVHLAKRQASPDTLYLDAKIAVT